MSKKAIIIDGNSLVYRAYYATWKTIDLYKQNNMMPVNALKLSTSLFLKLLEKDVYDYVFIAFDHHKKTFRNDMLECYKANRKKTPDDLINQLPLIKGMIENVLNAKWVSKEGYEADDLIGSFANLCNKHDICCNIFSSDRDMLQLVNDKTDVYLMKTGVSDLHEYNIQNFSLKTGGLKPEQFVDYKAIIGDKSDNFPGVLGIGEKTALSLILKYGSLYEIYNNIDELTGAQKSKFVASKDVASLSHDLAKIKLDLYTDSNIVEQFLSSDVNTRQLKALVDKFKFSGFDKWIK